MIWIFSINSKNRDFRVFTKFKFLFYSDAAQNPLDYIHKAETDGDGPALKQIQVTAQPAVLPKIVSGPTYTEPMDCLPDPQVTDSPMEGTTNPPTPMNVQQDDQENPGLSKGSYINHADSLGEGVSQMTIL